MKTKRLGLLAATVLAGCLALGAPASAQAPALIPTERARVVIGPPRDVVWQQGPAKPPAGSASPTSS